MLDDPKLIDKLYSGLDPDQANALRNAVARADRLGLTAYLAGGPVRDLLLGRRATDLDVVIEGDAIALAETVARDAGARIKRHPDFGTATVRGDNWHIDFITARAETYSRPGALPAVRPSTISDDLARRDFTINAMALGLNAPAAGKVLDPHGGRADLDARLIRTLHDTSFQDDATRIFRAARYSTRFGFTIESATLASLQRDIGYVDSIGGARIRREIERSLEEEHPDRVLARLHSLNALQVTHPDLKMTHDQSRALASLAPIRRNERPLAFSILAWEARAEEVAAIASRLALTKAQSDAVRAVPAVRDLVREPLASLRPSQRDAILSHFPLATVAALTLIDGGETGTAAREWLQTRTTRPVLRGDDLAALGVPRGPAIGGVLARLRAAKLDAEVSTRDGEEAWVREYLASNPK